MKRKLLVLSLLLISIIMVNAQGSYTLSLKVSAVTGENLTGTPVSLEHVDYGLQYPEGYLSSTGEVRFDQVFEGANLLKIEKDGLAIYEKVLDITKDTQLEVILQEDVRNPYALKSSVLHNPKTGDTQILLNWNEETDYFFDDFESYEPFAIEFSPWTGIDVDQFPAANLTGNYPNRGLNQYATIFNPLEIDPPVWYEYPVLRPYSGKQYAGFIRTANEAANNDWLISPKIKVGVNNVVRFLAKAGDAMDERFKVYISTKGTEINDFVQLTTGNYESVNYKAWKKIEYNLSAYEGKDIYIAIQYISRACFMLMVDDFYVGPSSINPSKARRRASFANVYPEKFALYVDGDSIGTTLNTSHSFKGLAPGEHTLGVKAIYRVSSSDVSTLGVNMPGPSSFAEVTFNFASNGVSPDGCFVNFIGRGDNKEMFTDTIKDGKTYLKAMMKGEYLVSMDSEDFEPFSELVTISENRVVNVALKEKIVKPYNITVDMTVNASTQKTDALVRWNQYLGWSDNFESYDNFVQSFGDWTTVDADGMTTYAVSFAGAEVSFPGVKGKMPCLIFNAKATKPSMYEDGAARAPEGDKCVAFFSAEAGQSNDWLISPKQRIREGYVVRFLAKSYTSMYTEKIRIMISESKDIESFTELDMVTLSDSWYEYQVDLSAYAGKDVYLAVNYVSYDAFFSLLDSFYVGPAEDSGTENTGSATYDIYLNGTKLGNTKDCSYTISSLDDGSYTVGVVAVYKSGESEMSEYSFTVDKSAVSGVAKPDIRIYAVSGSIYVRCTVSGDARVEVYNTMGQLVSVKSLSGEAVIPVPVGFYTIKVDCGGTSVVRQVVVK